MTEKIVKTKTHKLWIKELDILRAFAVLAVIMIHTTASFTEIKTINSLVFVNVFIDVFSHFAVPVFIIISGIVLSYNYYEHINYKSYYIKRILSIIPQYLFFSLFYLVFYYFIETRNPSIFKSVYLIFSGEASYHLWFFRILIQFYFIYPLLIKLYMLCKSKNKLRYLIIGSFLIQILYYILSIYLPTQSNPIISRLINDFIDKMFISYIFYFVIGIHFGRNIEVMKTYINNVNDKMIYLCLILSNILISFIWIKGIEIYGYFYKINKLFVLPSIIIEPLQYILSFILLWKTSSKLIQRNNLIYRFLKDIGKLSFGIYLVHVFYMVAVTKMLMPLNISFSSWIFYPIIFFSVSILSYSTCKLISYTRFSYYLIGVKS